MCHENLLPAPPDWGSIEVSAGENMKAIDQPFGSIINGSKQFIIPVFQRDYRWEEEQCKQLWLDVLRAARSKGSHRHFLGSIVYVSTGDVSASFTRWLLIDGQQRLTTLTLLLAALRDHIAETKWAGPEDDENAPTVQQIDAYFLQNVQESDARRPKLMLRRQDHETLQSIITGTPRPSELSARIVETYELFRDLVANEDPSQVYAGISNLVLVDVSLDRKTDDPQLVFESLNSTGIDLSQSDLIRNFILMQLTEQEQTKLYTSYWSQIESLFRGAEQVFDAFARDYIALKTRATKQTRADSVYFAFRNAWDALRAKIGSVDDVLADMLRHAKAFAAFSLGRHEAGAVPGALTHLRWLVDAPAMLVMRLLECQSQKPAFTASQMVEAIRTLEAYVLRRAICREQTRGYWQVFANLAYDIDQAGPLDSLKVGLVRLEGTYRAIKDDDFRRALEADDIYNLRVCRYLLDRMENFNHKELTLLDNLSIEHIMPQTMEEPWRKMLGAKAEEIHAAWLHRLGNLTLTAYNSEYSKHAFEKKKTMAGGFNQSPVRLNQFVREQIVWTETQMAERSKLMAAQAMKIWPQLGGIRSFAQSCAGARQASTGSRECERRLEGRSQGAAASSIAQASHRDTRPNDRDRPWVIG